MATLKKTFKFHMLDSKFYPVRNHRWVQLMERVSEMDNDSFWAVQVYSWSDSRTLLQNNAYHGPVLQQLCDFTGYTPPEMKDLTKRLFAPKEPYLDMGGNLVERRKGTSEMSIIEKTDFLNDIIDWAAIELGLSIDIDPDLRTSGLKPRIPDNKHPQWEK